MQDADVHRHDADAVDHQGADRGGIVHAGAGRQPPGEAAQRRPGRDRHLGHGSTDADAHGRALPQHVDDAALLIQQHQISPRSRLDASDAGVPDDPGGCRARHLHHRRQPERGVGEHERDDLGEVDPRPGQQRAVRHREAAVRVEFDVAADRLVVAARGGPGQGDRVRGQERAARALRSRHRRQRVGGQVVTVADQPGGEPVVGQLRPDRVRVPGQRREDAVAQVRGQGRARVGGRLELPRAGVGVAERDPHAGRHDGRDLRGCPLGVRGDGHVAQRAVAGPAGHLGGVHRADLRQVVRSARPVLPRKEGSFDVRERDRRGDDRVGAPGVRDGPQGRGDRLFGAGDDRRYPAGDPAPGEDVRDTRHRVRGGFGAVDVEAAIAVDLQVDQPRDQPRQAGIAGGEPVDGDDALAVHLGAQDLPGGRIPPLDHRHRTRPLNRAMKR